MSKDDALRLAREALKLADTGDTYGECDCHGAWQDDYWTGHASDCIIKRALATIDKALQRPESAEMQSPTAKAEYPLDNSRSHGMLETKGDRHHDRPT